MTKSLCFFLLLLSLSHSLFSQNKKYDIYVKKGCSNCLYTEQNVKTDAVNYLWVDSLNNGPRMVRQLKELGYNGRIVMPVIIADDSIVLHPVHLENGKYIPSALKDVVESVNNNTIETIVKDEFNKAETDCDYKQELILYYVVCFNSKSEVEALKKVKELHGRGYSHADFIFYKKWFRVFINVFDNWDEADVSLDQLKLSEKVTYILKEIRN
ncbi:SPOR domain-containing protein [Plebeiibacterium marinum]|uniref:SPOR domain-containing protein n=1 Tax=Plebeiibacterium marinum TaxID=2992111 RepID=A0AAE3MIH2_9BACT|nr:SPOR domain-containing protein [Plebeiobacterium marinum]MCW3807960.1 SPOR domain-containing protein [Plebeiobacterium marinum]